jgi:hypothetical protein
MDRIRRAPLVAVLLVALTLAGTADAAGRGQLSVRQTLAASVAGQWRTWWGNSLFGTDGLTLSSSVPAAVGETHSALVTSKRAWRDQTISFTTTTLAQLRTGTAPNPWEVGWVMLRFQDLRNYYWFMIKTDGFELGKKQGSDRQIFLATGAAPRLELNRPRNVRVQAQGARIRVWVDGTQIVDFTDPHPLLSPGSVGLYEEDSLVRFDSFTAN